MDNKTIEVVEHVDNKFEPSISDPEKPAAVGVDRFGARAKTDPEEIALVRKLDYFMMVSASVLTNRLLANTDVLNFLANSLGHVLPQLP
jgi:hypothetical protein